MPAGSSPSPTAQVLEILNKVDSRLNKLEATDARAEATRDTGAVPVPAGNGLWRGAASANLQGAAPFARIGENILGSRGYSYGKAMLSANGRCPGEDKIERLVSDSIFQAVNRAGGFNMSQGPGHTFVPIWPEAFNSDLMGNDDYYGMKCMIQHGASNNDPDETGWYQQKMGSHLGKATATAASPAQSWTDQAYGGSFVPPPTFGPPIELLRNREALLNAGATVVPLGPSGRITYPRLVGPTTSQGQIENTATAPVVAQTGRLELVARKMITIVVLPNELLRFGAPATEALIRQDIFKSVALQLDYYLLQGNGSQTQPLGLATMGAASGNPYGMAIVTPNAANQLAAQDCYSFPMLVEENNGDPDKDSGGYIMRPQLCYAFAQARWTSYSGGANTGGFLFEFIRDLKGKAIPHLAGYPVTKTVQVSNTRGSGAQTYVLFSGWADYLLGMFGAIEFMQTDVGYTMMASDQTAVRAILTGDGGPRHPGTVAFCDAVNLSVSG